MRSDARYTALLVARGDDDEFRHEDFAPSKDNSTAYSSGIKGRNLPAATVVRQRDNTNRLHGAKDVDSPITGDHS